MNTSTKDTVTTEHTSAMTRYAADLFLQLSPDEQKSVIDLIKSLLSEQ